MKKTLFFVMSFAVVSFLAVNCSKEESGDPLKRVPPSRIVDVQRVQSAMEWFGEHNVYTKSNVEWIPVWEDAFTEEQGSYQTVEVPLCFKTERLYVLRENRTAFAQTGDFRYLSNITRFVVEKNVARDTVRGFFMTVVPSKGYLESGRFTAELNSYCFRDSLFSGLVVYRDLEGAALCVWKYERGRAVQFLLPAGAGFTATKSDWYCETTTTVEWTEWTYNNSDRKDISGLTVSESTECWEIYGGNQEMVNWIDGPSGGGGGGALPSEPWWGEGHDRIITDALGKYLNKEQLDLVKQGSADVDKKPYQELKYSYMHAMLQPGQTFEDGVAAMRNFFIESTRKFLRDNDYVALGMALHCIQDAYSPAHEFQYWTGSVYAWIPHLFEGSVLFPMQIDKAIDGTEYVYKGIVAGNGSNDTLYSLFEKWLLRYMTSL